MRMTRRQFRRNAQTGRFQRVSNGDSPENEDAFVVEGSSQIPQCLHVDYSDVIDVGLIDSVDDISDRNANDDIPLFDRSHQCTFSVFPFLRKQFLVTWSKKSLHS